MVVAVALGAGAGSLLGVLTAPASQDRPSPALIPATAGNVTTVRPQRRFAGVSSTSIPRQARLPASTAAPRPATTASLPTTTTTSLPPTTTTTGPTTTSTTTGDSTTSSSDPGSSTTVGSTST
jgi:hypothetical protein